MSVVKSGPISKFFSLGKEIVAGLGLKVEVDED